MYVISHLTVVQLSASSSILPLKRAKRWSRTLRPPLSASPPFSDCGQLICNIEGTDGDYTTIMRVQRTILKYGECKLLVYGSGTSNIWFKVTKQDVIDIICESKVL
ncbi:hypothetical protein VHEMI10599 [[Torrubiella] hemipterigena]|uniref:Ecp2 effector protein-like domain-containing protein n=1 Tax=[Torrubiella] hemipterigena TaxID=1531966 RepID=A0A0A1TTH9_9HYPO|nr:hypothetical protein VHEMI10599 [[Torrubiella] hemipterigena]